MTHPKVQFDGNESSPMLVLAHGAGSGSHSDFMNLLTQELVDQGVCVARFNFKYMAWAQEHKTRRPPPRLPVLIEEYRRVIEWLDRPCFVGGKSMGGRIASHLLLDSDLHSICGGIAFGFPFHPIKKPERLRTEHILHLEKEFLILQGSRDPFGSENRASGLHLGAYAHIEWCPDGDHDLIPRKRSGMTQADNLSLASQHAATFMRKLWRG